MTFLDYILVFLVMIVPGLYIFNIYKYFLINRSGVIITRYLFIILFFCGLIYSIINNFNNFSCAFGVAMASPLIHSLMFNIAFNYFKKKYRREPRDVAFNFESGVFPDQVFAFIVVLGFLYFSFAFIGIFLWGQSK